MTPATATSRLMAMYPPPPVTFVRGEGPYLWDYTGRRYLDLLSGLAVPSLGHAHPAVSEALGTQAATLVHVSNLFGTTIGPEVARTLDRLVGDGTPGGGREFFCNSGAEAKGCSTKLARRCSGSGPRVGRSCWGTIECCVRSSRVGLRCSASPRSPPSKPQPPCRTSRPASTTGSWRRTTR